MNDWNQMSDLTQPTHIPSRVSTGEGVTVPTPTPTPRTDRVCRQSGALCHRQRRRLYLNHARTLECELQAKDAEIARLKETGLPQTCTVKIPTDNGLGYFIGTDEFGKRLVETFIVRAEAATTRVTELERQLAEAGEDKARLDWLESVLCYPMVCLPGKHAMEMLPNRGNGFANGELRAAIDAARDRKEQP